MVWKEVETFIIISPPRCACQQ